MASDVFSIIYTIHIMLYLLVLHRWGYNSVANMKAAWQRTLDSGIPFDVQWGDIDYMDRYRIFFTFLETA